MLPSGADAGDPRKTVVTALTTVPATAAGSYCGTLGAQNSAEDARRPTPTPPAQSPSPPTDPA